jgi:hypothetical protein
MRTLREQVPCNPEKYHFGMISFTTNHYALEVQTSCISFCVKKGELDGGTCPGIFLDYAINKIVGISQGELGFSPTVSSNIVRY